MIELVPILVFAFVLRIVFLSGFTTDDMAHLAFVRMRSRKRSFFDNTPPDSVIPGNYGYPMLAHWIISRFPKRLWKAAGKLLNILYDLLLVTATWGAARLWIPEAPNLPLQPATLAALAVATSPSLLPITARIKSLGARSLGNVLIMGLFLALWAGSAYNLLVFGVLAVFLGVVVFTTSQFGTQAFVLSAPFLAILSWNLLPLAVLLCVVILLVVASRCKLKICKGLHDNVRYMIEHKRWYCRNAQRGTTAMGRNRLRDLLDLPSWWKSNKDVFFGILFRRNSFVIALYSFPLFWVALYAAFKTGDAAGADSLLIFSVDVIFALACVFLLTSTEKLSFLGQAERYFEYAVPFGGLVLANQLVTGAVSFRLVIFLLLLQVVFSLCNLAYTNFAEIKKSLAAELEDSVVEYLDTQDGLRVLTIPMKLGTYYSYAGSRNNSYYFKLIVHQEHGMEHRDEEMPWLELPCEDLDVFCERYGVNTIIVEKPFLAKAEAENGVQYDLSGWELAFETEIHAVYRNVRKET